MPTVFPVVMFEDKNNSLTVFNKRISLSNTITVSVGPFNIPQDEAIIKTEFIEALKNSGLNDLTEEWSIRQGTKRISQLDWILLLNEPVA